MVLKGDTLGLIAKKYGTTTSQLVQANNLGKTPVLKIGHTLIIPMSDTTPPQPKTRLASTSSSTTTSTAGRTRSLTYTVKSGDTLAKIAARYNTTVEKLKTWNHLSSTRLVVGKKLIIGTEKVEAAN